MKTIWHKIIFLTLLLSVSLTAQDFSGIKIYINPGHGGHDSDDRYIAATGYWESEGNLTKGLYLRDLLESLGATVILSRTQNRTVDDRALSEIAEEANANNVDYFHSIHSNAYNAAINYPLLLFRGYDNDPVFPDAKRMGGIMWNEMNKANQQWTHWGYSWENNRGDWSFYGSTYGLGVLRPLEMPGTLSEGSFHDYVPNSWRLQSIDYRKHESVVILRSFIDYFGLERLPYGMIAGLVRAKNLNVDYSYNYNSGLPNDKKMALDFAKVYLLPRQKGYLTDGNKNGFFMFDSLQPGSYSVVFEGGEFKADTVQVTVTADETVFANGFLEQDPDKPPLVFYSFPADSMLEVDTYSSIEIAFSRPMDAPSTEKAFKIEPAKAGSFSWRDEYRLLRFRPDSAYALNQNYTVTLSDSAQSSFGVPLDTAFVFSFQTAEEHCYPRVSTYYPSAAVDSAFTHTEIYLEFDQSMLAQPTESAFRIAPHSEGSFEWQNSNKKLVFHPHEALIPDTTYRITVLNTAINSYYISMQDSFSYTFRTRKINQLLLTRSFPFDMQQGVSPQMYFNLQFANEIDEDSFSDDNFELRSQSGERMYIRKLNYSSQNGIYKITFKPKNELERKTEYTLFIYPGISSPLGYSVQDTLLIHFKTDSGRYVSGTLLDGFENLNSWRDPLSDEMTMGIDSLATYFIRTSSSKINGSYAGRLIYGFSADSGGVCRIYNTERPSIGAQDSSEFGLWVFADFSQNNLEFCFDRGDSSLFSTVERRLDWYGWKLVRFPLAEIPGGGGEVFFQGLLVRQQPNGQHSEEVYFDDLQRDVVVGLQELPYSAGEIKGFSLAQSYPNPFNPETTIEFFLPRNNKIHLSVYNVLGQRVKTLIHKMLPAGAYRYRFNGADLASGIYIYELKTAEIVLRKRMVYLK